MLLDEARIWVRLQHPNIVHVVEFGETEDRWFLALELIDGLTASDLIAAGGGVSNPALMARLARAVAPIRLRRIDEFGIPSEAKEALAFALLGHAGVMGIPGNIPRATGARRAVVLGKWTWP